MTLRPLTLCLAATLGLLSIPPALAGSNDCPSGLAKKAVPCVPPGQAKKWRMGERLPANVAWYEITDWDRYGLPEPRDGSRYIMIDRDVLLIAIATGIVLDYLGMF